MNNLRGIVVNLLVLLSALAMPSQSTIADPMISTGRAADPGAKTLAELRAAERRRIPLEVYLKASPRSRAGDSVEVTIIVTNLFPNALLFNSRMLVNHPRLQGEIAFKILDAAGNPLEIQTLVTPLTIRQDDFVMLSRGESVQRTVDLADIFGMRQRGSYKVQAYYHNDVDYVAEGTRAWKGRVWSEAIDIELTR